jgi:hypothetical protein
LYKVRRGASYGRGGKSFFESSVGNAQTWSAAGGPQHLLPLLVARNARKHLLLLLVAREHLLPLLVARNISCCCWWPAMPASISCCCWWA